MSDSGERTARCAAHQRAARDDRPLTASHVNARSDDRPCLHSSWGTRCADTSPRSTAHERQLRCGPPQDLPYRYGLRVTELDTLHATSKAYDAIAPTYAQLFHDPLHDRPLERALLSAFAELARTSGDGAVADLGCGPGHFTAHLHGLGLKAFGVDASPVMIELAREANPGLRFEVGSMAALDIEDGALGGVLSRWSVIHTPPKDLPAVLAEIARVLAPGGHLLIDFPATDGPHKETQAYDHTVVTAYRWSPDLFAELLRDHGLAESARLVIEPKPTDQRQFQEVQLLACKA